MALKKKKPGETPGLGISKLFQESSYRAPEGTRRLPTLDIMPDPEQPRRLLPLYLYDKLFHGEQSPTNILAEWLALAKKERASRAIKQAVADLEQLAATISWRDLISPITIRSVDGGGYPAHVRYLIRTGERRWWAHIWLILHNQTIGEEQESPETIRAIIEEGDATIRADQWVENQARTDFSVVENASGLESVRAEMSRGKPKLAPWRDVDAKLGISMNYRLRIIGVMKLTDEVRGLIAEHGLTERAVRPLVDKLTKHPQLQLIALEKLLDWRENGEDSGNTRLTKYIESLLKTGKNNPSTASHTRQTDSLAWIDRFEKSVTRVLTSLDNQELPEIGLMLANKDYSLQTVRDLRDRLNEILTESDNGQ